MKVPEKTPETIGVVIATYHRPADLARCLKALDEQMRLPDDVIVVAREDDVETSECLQRLTLSRLSFRVVPVFRPGLVAARNAGLNACRTDVLAFTDDDTVPHPDWVSRILEAFIKDPLLGGLGGRDRCYDSRGFDERRESVVGKIQWFGKAIGNHHRGFGEIREVEILKGANMSYRASAIKDLLFDTRLKGEGTQPHDDKSFSTSVKLRGWKLAYDPAALVDHYPGFQESDRQYAGVKRLKSSAQFYSSSYNEVLSIWYALSPLRKIAFFVWSILVGTGTFPGLVQAIRFTPQLGLDSWRRFSIAQGAKLRAYRDLLF